MQNKKVTKYLAVSLLATFAVTACDDIEARPSKNSDEATLLSFTDEVFGNNYQSLNDSYHGDVAAKTLDEILYTYAINVVGPYNAKIAKTYASKVTVDGKAVNPDELVTLEAVYNDNSKASAFVAQHPAYNVGDKAIDLIKARYEAMKDDVAEAMFNKISGATENNKFSEKELLVSLYSQGKKVANPYESTFTGSTEDKLVLPSYEPEEVFTSGLLHESFYTGADYSYIEDDILPDIYRDALVQQYIFDVQSKSLGSSSARKVNYVAIKYDDADESLYADKLVKSFVTKHLLKDNGPTDIAASFDTLSSIWNGEFMNDTAANVEASSEWTMLEDFGLVGATIAATTEASSTFFMKDYLDAESGKNFITGSAYGDLVEDYAKLNDNPAKSTATKDYTGGNKYVKEIGFEMESDKISLNDHTKSGWSIKSGSVVSSLPDSVKNRLYNLSVATGINDGTAAAITVAAEGITVGTTNKYLAKYGNNYFLRNGSLKVNQDAYESIIFHDTGSHTYYIVAVEAAVSANYMNETAKDNYALRIDVASLLSTSDTNITLSKKNWIEKCEIKYHDQSVYDYFESNFPELFEDD